MKGDIGVIGLAVMGQNLILNMNDRGFKVVAYNRTTAKVDDFLNGAAKGTNIIGAYSLQDLVDKLEKPRKIMMMVREVLSLTTLSSNLSRFWNKATLLLTAATPTIPIPPAAPTSWRQKASALSARAFPAAKKARVTVRPSCPAATKPHGLPSNPSSKPLPPKPRKANPAATGSAATVQAISSKWCTTASNTAICS